MFDAYGRSRRAEEYAAYLTAMQTADESQHAVMLTDVIGQLQLGRLAERLLWAIHLKVLDQKTSVVILADFEIATALWGPNSHTWPTRWRRIIRPMLNGLQWLHLADGNIDDPPLGSRSALISHVRYLHDIGQDRCPAYCPGLDGPRHHHFLVNVGRGFLGELEKFAVSDEETGERTYDFPVGNARSHSRSLRRVGKTGRLMSAYLPAKLGDPQICSSFTADQHQLLQSIVRETTRKRRAARNSISDADVFAGNCVAGVGRGNDIECPFLAPDGNYVGFNGNKKLRGQGYRIATAGGWMAKAGIAVHEIPLFLTGLANLAEQLGLIVLGLMPRSGTWYDLAQLQAMTDSVSGRRLLRQLHLRIYTAADYIERWNSFFQWSAPNAEPDRQAADRLLALTGALRRCGITKRALALGLAMDPSLVCKIIKRKRPCDSDFLAKVHEWIATRRTSEQSDRLRIPLVATAGQVVSGLPVALAYRQRGWAVIPQIPGSKRPPIKWKAYQTQLPTEEEINCWWTRWPQAGIALIAGPLSGVLVIDVDGTDAHNALIEHLGGEPVAPKVFSGSREPNRYHLFFRHPNFRTRAKATPWHKKLEFRGHAGLAVLPPSLHRTGNLYVWAPGRSLDDLALPELPAEILAALQPTPRPLPPASVPPPQVSVRGPDIAASPSTREFLSGRWANGPRWNERLFLASCDLHARGIPRAVAEPLLMAGAQPFNAEEANSACQTIASAFSQPREPARS